MEITLEMLSRIKHIIVLSEHKTEPEILMNNERGWSDASATTENL